MSRFAQAITVSLVIGITGVISDCITVRYGLDEKIGLDLLFRLRGATKPPSEVIIVSIDKISAEELGLPNEPEKWPRLHHANLVETLTKKGAAVIVFDMRFSESNDDENDVSFASAISNAGNVVLCQHLNQTPEGDKVDDIGHLFKQSALALAPFVLPKDPAKKRCYWLFKPEAGNIPTLPVVAFQIFASGVYDEFIKLVKKYNTKIDDNLFLDKDNIFKSKQVVQQQIFVREYFNKYPEVGDKLIKELDNPDYLPSDTEKKLLLKSLAELYMGQGIRYLNFYGPPGTIKTISYSEALKSDEKTVMDYKGKVVFVGTLDNLNPVDLKDGYDTVYPGPGGIKMSGVEIAATAFANLLERRDVRPAIIPVYCLSILILGVGITLLCFFLPPSISAASLVTLGSLYLGIVHYQFKNTGTWYPISIPLFIQGPIVYFGILLWKFSKTNKERKNIKEAFQYYLPEPVVDHLARNLGSLLSETKIVYGTCLFSDGEQYTALSEKLSPQELSIFMNSYYESVFWPVKEYGGVVSDVIGDSMLSIWATAQPDTINRKKACDAALAISNAVQQFKQHANTLHLPTRIGMHSGYISIGNVGAIDHYEYRPVGDIVNTASRIENLNKHTGTHILISEDVLNQIDGFLTRKIGEFIFRGKTKKVVIFELLSHIEESSKQQKEICTFFTEGLNAYYSQSWDEAISAFQVALKTCDQDGPSKYYLAMCENYRVNPPGEIWNGVIHLDNQQ